MACCEYRYEMKHLHKTFFLPFVLMILAAAASAGPPKASPKPPQPHEGFENIAHTARVSSKPRMPPDALRKLIDGNPDPKASVAFPVKSKGAGLFTFSFPRPRTVAGLYFCHPHKWYLIKTFQVVADVKGRGKYTATLGTGKATHAEYPSWEGLRWKPTQVRGLRLVPLTGYAGANRAYPCLSEVIIFGKPLPTDQGDAIKAGNPVSKIRVVRPISRDVDLSGTRRPLVILLPEEKAYRPVAEHLAAVLKERLGVPAMLTDDPNKASPSLYNVIAVGNMNNNELMARLYFNQYLFADSLYPGDGEYTLRTIYDPYPWHGKGDVIGIGCSDPKGAERGVTELLRRTDVETKSLGYTLVVSAPEPVGRIKPPTRAFKDFRDVAVRYLKTGHPRYARATITALETIAGAYSEAGQKGEALPHIQWTDEMQGFFAMAAWDAFEEHPTLTDDQRLRFTKTFMHYMDGLTHRVSGLSGIGPNSMVAYNHTTYPLSGVYAGARYFWAYYRLGRAKKYLQKCYTCFMAQAKCWKPSEDADNYLETTMETSRRYWLGEWKLDFFKNGNAVKYAEYQIAIRDSRGQNSGFGDSGLGRTAERLTPVLEMAYWYTRDGRYPWLLRHHNGEKWKNPHYRDVAPVPDTSHLGIRVFRMAPLLYEWTKRGGVSGVPRRPPNVPKGTAFDKIAFRESWDKSAQYLLLDGYAHGHHLHFDGNAINVFADRGRQWLIDHDYLIRNSTEHNMVSVIRNGRADRLMPSCAALVASGQGAHVGMTTTEMRDYLGLNWSRSLFWKKGDYFVVMERMEAKQPGEYAVDCTWKVEDRGTEHLVGPGVFRVDRPEVFASVRDVRIIADKKASGGKAVLMGETTSRWSFVVEAPPGEYRITLRAYGMNTSADSLFVATAGTARGEFHLPRLRYGSSRATWRERSGATTCRFPKGRRHVVSVWMREKPPVRIDKVLLADTDGKPVWTFEAENAPQATPADLDAVPADRLWLKCADPAETRITRYTSMGITAPLCKLWQRTAGTLARGEEFEFANLLYTEGAHDPMSLTIKRIAPHVVLVTGDDTALCAVGPVSMGYLQSDAQMLFLSPDHVGYCGGRSVQIGVHQIALTGKPGGEITVTAAQTEAIRVLLRKLKARERGPAQGPRENGRKPTEPVWSHDCDGKIRRLRTIDLDGDGQHEILIAAGGQAIVFSAKGERLWSCRVNGRCNDINAGELTSDPGLEVVLAASDFHIHLLTSKGEFLRKVENRGTPRYSKIGDLLHEPLTAAILNTDGTPRVFVADTGYKLQTYNGQLKEIWEQWRGCTFGGDEFHVADVNGDGKKEVFVTDHYGGLVPFDHLGKVKPRYYTSIGDMQAALGDMDGDGTIEAVYGSTTGDLRCSRVEPTRPFTGKAKTLWTFNNYGYPVNRVRMADLDGDGKAEGVIASGTGYLYVLDVEGRVKWQRRAQTDVVDVVVLKGKAHRLAYIDRAGSVTCVDGKGQNPQTRWLKGSPSLLAECDGNLIIALDKKLCALPILSP